MFLALLSACGGGGGGGATPPPAVSQSAEGIWMGTETSTPINQTFPIIGIVSPAGAFHFVEMTSGTQYVGSLSVSGSNMSGTAIGVGAPGWLFLNGLSTTTATLTGSVQTGISASGTYTAPNDSGTWSLTYSPIYDRPIPLSSLAKTWVGVIHNGAGNPTATITVSAAGVVSGTDTLGCVYNGSASVVTPNKNLFSVSISTSVCHTGVKTYNGFSFLSDNAGAQNNMINFAATDGTSTFAGQLL